MSEQSRSDNGNRGNSADSVKIVHDIALQALALAKQARDLGLPTLGYLLETAALEASAGLGFSEEA